MQRRRSIARRPKAWLDSAIGSGAVALMATAKRLDRKRTADFAGSLLRKIGPLLKEHRIGRENLHAAFPEKSAAEIEHILRGVWDNLGRIAIEFAHLDEFAIGGDGPPSPDSISYTPASEQRLQRLVASGTAIIGFAGHLANWELPALAAKRLGVQSAVLYRRPNIRAVSDMIDGLRTPLMGQLIGAGLDTPVKLARLLQSGVNVGILVDQHFSRGVDVMFFGRRCKANPLVALLARQTNCPIHGMRIVRLPDHHHFWIEITDPIEPARSPDGEIDIQGTMQVITGTIEGWVREHPEQWLWLHRRWR